MYPYNWNDYYAYAKKQERIKTVLLLLFILSFFTLFFAIAIVGQLTGQTGAMTENMWVFFLFVPIPLASFILGIIYKPKGFKATKNIVAGAIFTILLVIYGSFTFMFNDIYLHDYSYIDRIEAQIGFDLPDSGTITTQDWASGEQTGTENVRYIYSSDVVFTNEDEIAKFNEEISQSELWMTTVSTPLLGQIPSMFSYLPSFNQYDYFMIYNADLEIYNSLPEESGTYAFTFIAYDSQNGTMKIGEYLLEILI